MKPANDTRLAVNNIRVNGTRVKVRTELLSKTKRENRRRDERETGAELYIRQETVYARRRGARLTDVGGVRERGGPSAVFPRKPHRLRPPLSSVTVAAADSCAAASLFFPINFKFKQT